MWLKVWILILFLKIEIGQGEMECSNISGCDRCVSEAKCMWGVATRAFAYGFCLAKEDFGRFRIRHSYYNESECKSFMEMAERIARRSGRQYGAVPDRLMKDQQQKHDTVSKFGQSSSSTTTPSTVPSTTTPPTVRITTTLPSTITVPTTASNTPSSITHSATSPLSTTPTKEIPIPSTTSTIPITDREEPITISTVPPVTAATTGTITLTHSVTSITTAVVTIVNAVSTPMESEAGPATTAGTTLQSTATETLDENEDFMRKVNDRLGGRDQKGSTAAAVQLKREGFGGATKPISNSLSILDFTCDNYLDNYQQRMIRSFCLVQLKMAKFLEMEVDEKVVEYYNDNPMKPFPTQCIIAAWQKRNCRRVEL